MIKINYDENPDYEIYSVEIAIEVNINLAKTTGKPVQITYNDVTIKLDGATDPQSALCEFSQQAEQLSLARYLTNR